MKEIREKVTMMMEHCPTLSKLEGEKWYQVEDAIVNLICEITGVTDTAYETAKQSKSVLDVKLEELEPSPTEEKIYRKVADYYRYEDLKNTLEDCDTFSEKEIALIKDKAEVVIYRYTEDMGYDWRGMLMDAIYSVLEDLDYGKSN